MIFSENYPKPPQTPALALRNSKTSRFTEGNVYKTGMFSGPGFQAIASVEQWGEDGSVATFKCLPVDRFWRSTPEPDLVTDPIILDAAGQHVGHWNAENSSCGFNVFPYRLDELWIYGPNPAPQQRVESRLKIEAISKTQFRSDIDLIGPDGNLLFRMIGWEDKLFELPDTLCDTIFELIEIPLGTAWNIPMATLQTQDFVECRKIEKFSEDLLLEHGMIWLNVLAYMILSRQERIIWNKLDFPKKRAMEWLLGRAAAKDAVCNLLRKRYNIQLYPADIEIETNGEGQPLVKIALPELAGVMPVVSIAHKKGIAAAAAARESMGVGIDIEYLHPIQEGFVDMVFRPDEQDIISSARVSPSDEWILRLWCAKEAVAKAIGTGFAGNPQNIVMQRLNPENGTAEFGVSDNLVRIKPELSGVKILACTAMENNLISGFALYERRFK